MNYEIQDNNFGQTIQNSTKKKDEKLSRLWSLPSLFRKIAVPVSFFHLDMAAIFLGFVGNFVLVLVAACWSLPPSTGLVTETGVTGATSD